MAEYEYHAMRLPRGASGGHAHDVVSIAGEFGGWELARHVRYEGGLREVHLRRRPLSAVVEEPVEHPRTERQRLDRDSFVDSVEHAREVQPHRKLQR